MDQADAPEIIDDFEIGQDELVDVKDKEVNKHKLRRRAEQYKVSAWFCIWSLHSKMATYKIFLLKNPNCKHYWIVQYSVWNEFIMIWWSGEFFNLLAWKYYFNMPKA